MIKIFRNSNASQSAGVAVLFLAILTFISCEKVVDINLDTGDPNIVIEGGIETGLPPIVSITRSIGYFESISLATLQNSTVRDAEVFVSDGNKKIRLKQYTVDTGIIGFKFYYYSLADVSKPTPPLSDSMILGEEGKFYTLTVIVDGKTYESTTKIPKPTPLDSIITIVPNRPDPNPAMRSLRIYFKDPDSIGNCVRYYTSLNNGPMLAGLNSVYNDDIINGTYFNTELPLGEPRSTERSFDSLGVCYPGDTVRFKWAAIDKNVYNFWNTYEFALGTLGSPFASPIQVKSNISNGALGIWAGYGALYYTIVAK